MTMIIEQTIHDLKQMMRWTNDECVPEAERQYWRWKAVHDLVTLPVLTVEEAAFLVNTTVAEIRNAARGKGNYSVLGRVVGKTYLITPASLQQAFGTPVELSQPHPELPPDEQMQEPEHSADADPATGEECR
jgi:hypothetical protein